MQLIIPIHLTDFNAKKDISKLYALAPPTHTRAAPYPRGCVVEIGLICRFIQDFDPAWWRGIIPKSGHQSCWRSCFLCSHCCTWRRKLPSGLLKYERSPRVFGTCCGRSVLYVQVCNLSAFRWLHLTEEMYTYYVGSTLYKSSSESKSLYVEKEMLHRRACAHSRLFCLTEIHRDWNPCAPVCFH